MTGFSFGGHGWHALSDAALFWPSRSALLVADLHFEKASWFAGHGQMLPPYDSDATLTRLETLVDRTGAQEVWCLGDSFHDSRGPARLSDKVRERLLSLATRTRLVWITGNHDHAQADALGGIVLPEAEVDGVLLRHAANAHDPRPEISGHYHPVMRIRLRGRSVTRRCFIKASSKLILPAFGALTGGLHASDPAIRAVIGAGAKVFVPSGTQLLQFAMGSLEPH